MKQWMVWYINHQVFTDSVLFTRNMVQNSKLFFSLFSNMLKGTNKHRITRKHYSRMPTASLPTIRASVATRWINYGGGEVSSSELVWTGLQWWSPDVTSGGSRARGSHIWCLGGGQGWVGACIVRSSVSWVMVRCLPPPSPNWNRETVMSENITFLQLLWRAVNMTT